MKPEWREAASLGASGAQYWRMVGAPVLAPSVLGCFLLLFANAFGTLATVIALTGSNFSVVPILLFQQIRGNVLTQPQPWLCAGPWDDPDLDGIKPAVSDAARRAGRWQK